MPRDAVALSDAQRDRAIGALLVTAAGEFTSTGVGLGQEVAQ